MCAVGELSKSELVAKLEVLRAKEREVLFKLLCYLGEVDRRKLYLELGYSSLFSFCTQKLGYSEGAAQRRIQACRVMREHGEVRERIRAGELSLSSVGAVAPVLSSENKADVLKELKGASRREAERVAARYGAKKKAPRERVRAVAVKKEPVGSLFQTKEAPGVEERVGYSFSVSEELHAKCQRVKEVLSGRFPKGVSTEQMMGVLVDEFLKRHAPEREVREKKAKGSAKAGTRYIPAGVKREVWKRDEGCCSFVGSDGKRCGSRWDVEVDHIKPFARGGQSTTDNLRLVCRAHNGLLAERVFGKGFVSSARSRTAAGDCATI